MSAFDLTAVEVPARFDDIAPIMGVRPGFALDLSAGSERDG